MLSGKALKFLVINSSALQLCIENGALHVVGYSICGKAKIGIGVQPMMQERQKTTLSVCKSG